MTIEQAFQAYLSSQQAQLCETYLMDIQAQAFLNGWCAAGGKLTPSAFPSQVLYNRKKSPPAP